MELRPNRTARFTATLDAPTPALAQAKTIFLFQSNRRPTSPVKAALQDKGYRVIHAESIDAAHRIWAKSITPIDLFVADIRLQHAPGVQRLIQLFQAENSRLRVLYANDLEGAPGGIGAHDYPKQLIDMIEKSLDVPVSA